MNKNVREYEFLVQIDIYMPIVGQMSSKTCDFCELNRRNYQ